MLGLQWLAGLHRALAAQALGLALLPADMIHVHKAIGCLVRRLCGMLWLLQQ
jgi:hypothetical protein